MKKSLSMILTVLILLLAGFSGAVVADEHQVIGTVWVANEEGNSLSVIDASSNEVITTIEGIEGPHNVQVSPDGESVWAISGHDSLAVKINAGTYELEGTVLTGSHPAHIILSPDSKTVYVTSSEDNSVSVIDAESLEVITTIPVGKFPHGLRPSPDGKWVYVANVEGNTVSVIDTESNTSAAEIEVGERPVQVAVSPEGDAVYVSLNGENALGKIDVESRTLVDSVEVGNVPIQVFVTPDNAFVLAANQGTEENPGTTISIVNTETFAIVGEVETGDGAHGVVIEPSGQYAYIANLYADTVSVLDIEAQEVVTTIPVGESPNGISFLDAEPAAPPSEKIPLEISAEGEHEEHHD